MTNRKQSVLIKDLTDEGLVDHYIGLKSLVYNGAALRSRCLGYLMQQLDITIAIARKRGIKLPV